MTDTTASPITCEREFLQALRARRAELQIGYETMEAMADIPQGYLTKLFNGTRPTGALTHWLILQTLGLRIRLEEDPAQLERMRRHHLWMTQRRKSRRTRRWNLAIAERRREELFGPSAVDATVQDSA